MIAKRLQEVAEKNPNKIAFNIKNNSITYKELFDKATYYSTLLKREGNSPVIIYGDKSVEKYIAIFACILARRAYVPIGSCTPVHRLEQIKDMVNSSIVLEDDLSILDDYKDNKEYEIDNNIAYIIFTSGSTGEPKGVPISYDNLNNFIDWINTVEPLNTYKDITVLNTASFSFDLSVADIYYAISNGHTLKSVDVDMDNYGDIYEAFNSVDVAVMTPTFMKLCLINPEFNKDNYQDFKCVYFCGEQLHINLVNKIYNRFPDLKIINAYGPTEATSAVSAVLIDKTMLDDDLLPCGEISSSAVDIKIINDEIVLDGKSVFNGYINDKSVDKYNTGDLGYIKDNFLYCKGRKDDQVKYLGYRIELHDIEINANSIDGVSDSIVIAKRLSDDTVKGITLFVISNKSEDSIRTELRELIPGYMMPNRIVVMDKFPVNKNGKIDRKAMMNL